MKTLAGILIFTMLLVPSAWFAWQNRDMPQLGRGHDDAIYYAVSKSLADGDGYRILNLPGTPFETKYPPVLIWLLSLVWSMYPQFPQNLEWATALQWMTIPLFLALCLSWFRSAGLSVSWRWAALALLAVSPFTVSFGAGIYTEVLFGALLLASLLVCLRILEPRTGWHWAALAGLLAGLGYLTRTAGIVALISVPAVLLLWGKRREASVFFAAMAPFVMGWMAWAKWHQPPPADLAILYNTNYFGFFLRELHFTDLGKVVWTNLGHLLYAAGGLPLPMDIDLPFWPILRVTSAIGMIRGIYGQRANAAVQLYAVFALATIAELLIWNFPPNLRLMYTLVPLLAAGLMWEAQHLAQMLRQAFGHQDTSQRIAAWGISGFAALFCLGALWMQGYMTFIALPAQAWEDRNIRAENGAAFAWITQHTSLSDNILAINPVLYLYTGRHTQTLVSLPIYWYRGDLQRMLDPFRELSQHGSASRMAFLYLHDNDYDQLAPGVAEDARKLVATNKNLQPVFHQGRSTIYQLLQPASASLR